MGCVYGVSPILVPLGASALVAYESLAGLSVSSSPDGVSMIESTFLSIEAFAV